ncbi:MAG: GGDEF domain-containing protein [Pseudomonadales bacterium]|nr:GGDEF domain-containing protein [Pseudomonadales bacterium]
MPSRMLDYLEKTEKHALWLCFFLLCIVGMADNLTGYELSFSLFYLLPVSIVTWAKSRAWGIAFSLLSAFVWYLVDRKTGYAYSSGVIIYWNAAIRFCFFIIVTLLLSALKQSHREQMLLSRIDGLTGAVNSRYFRELLQLEIDRLSRNGKAFSLLYIDLDNFKWVNDHQGHSAGDGVLCAVVNAAGNNLRKIDVVARLGGDEFAILLPETSVDEVDTVVNKLRAALLAAMQAGQWPVTFSMGVVSCSRKEATIDEVIRVADRQMYEVKHNGKNNVLFTQV